MKKGLNQVNNLVNITNVVIENDYQLEKREYEKNYLFNFIITYIKHYFTLCWSIQFLLDGIF